MIHISVPAAFLAGLATFLSPCILPLIPSYFVYMTGLSLGRGDIAQHRGLVVLHTAFFVLGFSFVFIFLGLSLFYISRLLIVYQDIVRVVSGILIVIFGIHLSGLIKIPALYRQKQMAVTFPRGNVLVSFLIGAAFSFAWTPCAGPILGSILALSSAQETIDQGIRLLVAYAAGLAAPFLIAALLLDRFMNVVKRLSKAAHIISIVSGVLLILIGIIVATGRFSRFSFFG